MTPPISLLAMLVDLVEQIPGHQLRRAGAATRRPTPTDCS